MNEKDMEANRKRNHCKVVLKSPYASCKRGVVSETVFLSSQDRDGVHHSNKLAKETVGLGVGLETACSKIRSQFVPFRSLADSGYA